MLCAQDGPVLGHHPKVGIITLGHGHLNRALVLGVSQFFWTPQHSYYTSRRAEIRQALNPEPSRDYNLESYDDEGGENQVEQFVPPEIGYKKPPPQTKAFAAETAALTGQSKQEINRQLAVGKAIGDDLQRVVGTSLDKGVELAAYLLAQLDDNEKRQQIPEASRLHLPIGADSVSSRPGVGVREIIRSECVVIELARHQPSATTEFPFYALN